MKIYQLSSLSFKTVVFPCYLTEYFHSINGCTIRCPIWSIGAQLTTCLLYIIHLENTYLLLIFRVKCNFEFMRKGSDFDFLPPWFVFKFHFLNLNLAVENEGVWVLVESWVQSYVYYFLFLEVCQIYVLDGPSANVQGRKRFLGSFIKQEYLRLYFL